MVAKAADVFMKEVRMFEIKPHGVQHEQYFQGCDVSFTQYKDCFTGIGSNDREALEDALEQAAQYGYDVSKTPNNLPIQCDIPKESGEYVEGFHHYVSILMN